MKSYIAELHVHTCLSPCAEVEMIPPLIVQAAHEQGINLIAITDHNASANAEAVMRAAAEVGVTVLPGMELQTVEEVHLLCLFDTLDQTRAWQSYVDNRLPALENDAEHFGDQFIVDESGDFVRRETRLLLVSAEIALGEAVTVVHELGGLAIPAHVDRKAYSLIQNLGLIPEDVPFDALEISRHLTPEQARQKYPQLKLFPLIQSGDAHRLDELLGKNLFRLQKPTIAELKLALHGQEGRSFRLRSTRTE
ncbi:MAG: PHP domain-containing protein [Anaerolineae bacterium]|nr:PHP domain-containing protein [Thermoflexales bacterium]MDW8406465.1 PHP domain-containing protein [Anaerolineae bacterium]